MRMRFQSAACAVPTALAVGLFCAGMARAEVFDGAANIDDNKDADAGAFLVNDGTTAFVDLGKTCIEGEDSVDISAFTTHPDQTKAKDAKAEVAQEQKDNQPDIEVAGSGMMNFEVTLDCEKAEAGAKADLDKSKGKFEIKAKNCSGLTQDQLTFVRDVCATADNTKIKADAALLKKLKVKGKGDASEPPL
jgi:Fe-S cluster assembly iron-binding protein IscA